MAERDGRRGWTQLTALLLAAGLSAPAGAAELQVTVTDSGDSPLSQAAVAVHPQSGDVATQPPSEPVPIDQVDSTFVPHVRVIQTGTTVRFANSDEYRHHVYSFSATRSFEIDMPAGSPPKEVTFSQPGIVDIGCNIHDGMLAFIFVADTPWLGKTGADGQARVGSLPAGSYHLRVWHPDMPPLADPARRAVTLAEDAGNRAVTVTLAAVESR